MGSGAGARRSRRLRRRAQRRRRSRQGRSTRSGDPRQPRQGGLRDRRWQPVQSRGADGGASGPASSSRRRTSTYLRGLPMGPVQIDALTEICHGTPFDEDHYIFDGNDARHGAAGRVAAALPVRPHAPAGDVQDRRQDWSFEGEALGSRTATPSSRCSAARGTWSTWDRSASRATATRAPAYGVLDDEAREVRLYPGAATGREARSRRSWPRTTGPASACRSAITQPGYAHRKAQDRRKFSWTSSS